MFPLYLYYTTTLCELQTNHEDTNRQTNGLSFADREKKRWSGREWEFDGRIGRDRYQGRE